MSCQHSSFGTVRFVISLLCGVAGSGVGDQFLSPSARSMIVHVVLHTPSCMLIDTAVAECTIQIGPKLMSLWRRRAAGEARPKGPGRIVRVTVTSQQLAACALTRRRCAAGIELRHGQLQLLILPSVCSKVSTRMMELAHDGLHKRVICCQLTSSCHSQLSGGARAPVRLWTHSAWFCKPVPPSPRCRLLVLKLVHL